MSFWNNIAEQAKVAAMAQIPAAIETSKGKIIEAIRSYISKNPQQGDVIKRNLAEINAGIQTAGTRKRKIGGRKYGKSRKQKVKEIKK